MLQPPPLQLVHRAFGEFVVDAASIQPLPDTFDFVLESCAFLAEFYPDERVRQQQFNKRLEQYLGKPIYGVKLNSGISETDGSIVDNPAMAEVNAPCCNEDDTLARRPAISFVPHVWVCVVAYMSCTHTVLYSMCLS